MPAHPRSVGGAERAAKLAGMATAAAQDAADCAIVDQLGRSAGEWEQEHTARFQQIDQGAPLPAFSPPRRSANG